MRIGKTKALCARPRAYRSSAWATDSPPSIDISAWVGGATLRRPGRCASSCSGGRLTPAAGSKANRVGRLNVGVLGLLRASPWVAGARFTGERRGLSSRFTSMGLAVDLGSTAGLRQPARARGTRNSRRSRTKTLPSSCQQRAPARFHFWRPLSTLARQGQAKSPKQPQFTSNFHSYSWWRHHIHKDVIEYRWRSTKIKSIPLC